MIESDIARSPGDIMYEIAELKRQIREMRAERSLARSAITDQHGTIVALFGDLDQLIPGRHGFWLGRPGLTPSQAISVSGTGEGGDNGFVGIWDRDGNYVFTDDAQSGRGLGRPYLAMTMGDLTVPPATTSGSFVEIAAGIAALHHPVVYARVLVYSSAGGTTGEARLAFNGTPDGPTISIASTEFAKRDIGPFALASPPAYEALVEISAQARRTAGAGQIGLRVLSMLGLESAYA